MLLELNYSGIRKRTKPGKDNLHQRQIANEGGGAFDLEIARAIAEADLELARVRRVQEGLTKRMAAVGSFERLKAFATKKGNAGPVQSNDASVASSAPVVLPGSGQSLTDASGHVFSFGAASFPKVAGLRGSGSACISF